MKQAVIDIGTHSIQCTLAQFSRERTLLPQMNRAMVSRLGMGLSQSGSLQQEAMERSCEAVLDLVEWAKKKGAGRIRIIGTQALRVAENAQQFLERVQDRCGLEIWVLTGEEEACYSFQAVVTGLDLTGPIRVFDLGGGSTELMAGTAGEMQGWVSLPVGALQVQEEFFSSYPVTEEHIAEAAEALQAIFLPQKREIFLQAQVLVGMGGTVTSLGAVKMGFCRYDPAIIQGLVLTYDEVEKQWSMYRRMEVEAQGRIPGLDPKRAPIILGGTFMVKTLMEYWGVKDLIISDWGIRHGVLQEMFQGTDSGEG